MKEDEALRAALEEALMPYLELAHIDAVTADRIVSGVASRLAELGVATPTPCGSPPMTDLAGLTA